MLYLEAPAGVGYSYSTDKNYTTDDDQVWMCSIHQNTVLPYKGIRHLELQVKNARRRTCSYLYHCKVAQQTSTPDTFRAISQW